jgi:transcriptional regulator with XRE-family HTH domain
MNNEFYEKVGKNIRRWRKAKDLCQREVAEGIDMSMQAVANWEYGKPISIKSLIKLSSFFNIHYLVLLEGCEEYLIEEDQETQRKALLELEIKELSKNIENIRKEWKCEDL